MKFKPLRVFDTDREKLPVEIVRLASQKFQRLRECQEQNLPYDNSLRLKPMQGYSKEAIWEGHITQRVVFTFQWDKDQATGEVIMVLRRIGGHEVYDNP